MHTFGSERVKQESMYGLSSPPKKGDHCREVVVSGESNVQEMRFMLFLSDITPLTEYLRFILPLKRSKKS